MKTTGILALCLSFFCMSAKADFIKCYDNHRLIYSHKIHDARYDSHIFSFIEDGSEDIVFYSGNCVIKVDKNDASEK